MYWLVLVFSGVLEAVWATALGRSAGLTRLVPTVVFAVGLVASMAGLAQAMRGLPVGTAVAIDPENPDRLLFASATRVYLSETGGLFWRSLEVELIDITAIAFAEG